MGAVAGFLVLALSGLAGQEGPMAHKGAGHVLVHWLPPCSQEWTVPGTGLGVSQTRGHL